MSTNTTTRSRTRTRPVPTVTQPPAQITQAEAALFRDIAQQATGDVSRIKAALALRGISLDDLLKPADPYEGKSLSELAALAKTDPAALDALTMRLSQGSPEPEPEPEPDPLMTMDANTIALRMADFARDGNMAEFERYRVEWQKRLDGVNSEPVSEPDNQYGGYTKEEIRGWLLSPEGRAVAVALGEPEVGGTGRFPDWGVAAAIRALNAKSNNGTVSVPVSVPAPTVVQSTPSTGTAQGGMTVPSRNRAATGGRGGNYSDEANAYYLAEATKRLAARGTTPMDVARNMSPQHWATLSLGGSQIKNGKHGDPWEIPVLESGPLAGQPAITSNFKGSDTSFCFGMASWLAHQPRWSGKGGTAADGGGYTGQYAELARNARGDWSQGPTQKMWDRAASIVARAECVGIRPA